MLGGKSCARYTVEYMKMQSLPRGVSRLLGYKI